MGSTFKHRFLQAAAIVGIASGFGGQALAAPFTLNNVFVSTGVGTVLEYTPTGTLVQTLTPGTGFITGSAFDSSGNFYVTRFSNGAVQKYNSGGTNLGAFASSLPTPESVVIDATNNVYVGNVGNGIRKYNSTGTLLGTSIGTTRVDFMDLAADQTTMLYTQEGGAIRRVNVATNTPLSDFSTDVENAFALRIRSNGTVLVADGADIELLDNTGAQTGSYDIAGSGTWFAVNLDPDGTSFWAATTAGLIAHFDFGTGNVLNSWTVTGTSGVWGLALFGEITEGGGGGGRVPEPGILALLGLGMLGLFATRRRRA